MSDCALCGCPLAGRHEEHATALAAAGRRADEAERGLEGYKAGATKALALTVVEREAAESRAAVLAARVSALEGALRAAESHLQALMTEKVYAPALDAVIGQVLAASQKIRTALSAPALCPKNAEPFGPAPAPAPCPACVSELGRVDDTCGVCRGSGRCPSVEPAPAPASAAREDRAPPCGECGRTGTHKLDCGNARRARAMPAPGDAAATKTPEDRRDD